MPIVRPMRERIQFPTSEEAIADGDRIMMQAQADIDARRLIASLKRSEERVRPKELPIAIVRLRPLGWWNRIKGWFQ